MDNFQQGQQNSWLEKNKSVFIFLGIFLILAIVIVLIFLAIRISGQSKTNIHEPAPIVNPTPAATTTAVLPGFGGAGDGNNGADASSTERLAEKASFGAFYKPTSSQIILNPGNFNLPLNAKTEVNNYYDIDRKISLDAGLSSLNNNGFAILDNPLTGEADNFFQSYSALNEKQLPTLITGDFLIYYYQNVLKLAYQDVESSIFYDNLWAADWRLYQIAKQRYEYNLSRKDTVNDLALEATRLELAYFATALSLLAPTDRQISSAESGLSGSSNFSPSEASQYSLQLPAYLQDDVVTEVNLIRAGNGSAKSPVLLYQRDYRIFSVPVSYQVSARLNNFYLASRWLNSVFPLYYRDASCPNCFLDKDDWRINFSAAFLVSSDLAGDQNLKNRWAKIYKFQSYFSGLRGDLNYLFYQDAFNSSFSGSANIADILQGKPADNDANLTLLQNKLAAVNFSALEGGLDKTGTTTRPRLGLKILTDAYRPDDYIFNQLTYPGVGKFLGDKNAAQQSATACGLPNQDGVYRCVSSAYDLLNLTYPLYDLANDYFKANANYIDYDRQALSLQKMLANFNVDSWHASAFWTTQDINNKFLHAPELAKVSVMKSQAWQNKNIQTAIAAWANEELPADAFVPFKSEDGSRLNQSGSSMPLYLYVEPDLTLTRELIFNTRMIMQMLVLLKASDGENSALSNLKALEKNLTDVEAIIAKELQNQDLSDDDFTTIKSLSRIFSVKAAGAKSFSLTPGVGGRQLKENLAGVKLLVYTFLRGDRKFFALGPIFNWQESR
jgi:hypothetical protein